MKHHVAYHTEDVMGYPVSKVEQPQLLTRKAVTQDLLGDRIWVIEGAGRPRKYGLAYTFIAHGFEPSRNPDFGITITGRNGVFFRPSLPLDGLPWFEPFLRHVGNFGLGFQVIAVPEYVSGLEAVARAALP